MAKTQRKSRKSSSTPATGRVAKPPRQAPIRAVPQSSNNTQPSSTTVPRELMSPQVPLFLKKYAVNLCIQCVHRIAEVWCTNIQINIHITPNMNIAGYASQEDLLRLWDVWRAAASALSFISIELVARMAQDAILKMDGGMLKYIKVGYIPFVISPRCPQPPPMVPEIGSILPPFQQISDNAWYRHGNVNGHLHSFGRRHQHSVQRSSDHGGN